MQPSPTEEKALPCRVRSHPRWRILGYSNRAERRADRTSHHALAPRRESIYPSYFQGLRSVLSKASCLNCSSSARVDALARSNMCPVTTRGHRGHKSPPNHHRIPKRRQLTATLSKVGEAQQATDLRVYFIRAGQKIGLGMSGPVSRVLCHRKRRDGHLSRDAVADAL